MRLAYHLFEKHSELLDAKDAARARAINGFGLIVSSICITYIVVFLQWRNYEAALAVFFLNLICLIPILLNVITLYRTARYVYTFQAPIGIFLYAQVISGVGIDIFLIITFAFPFIFLHSTEKSLITLFFILNSFLLLLLEFGDNTYISPVIISTSIVPVLKIVVYFIAIAFAGILFFNFFRAVRLTESDLMEAKVEAEKASKARKEFLATMSHELRTPLNSVITIASMLNESQSTDSEQTSMISSLQLSADNLLKIINDILEFSKLEAGKIYLYPKPTDIHGLMNDLVKTYKFSASEKGLTLGLVMDKSISNSLIVDDIRLGQIISNLVGNAIKFTQKGSIDIEVRLLEEKGDCQNLRFTVCDTGLGIREDELDEIFESFNQSRDSTYHQFGGTGLGLSIVKRLLEEHDSSIKVSSEYAKGTQFMFDLQLRIGPDIDQSISEESELPELGGLNILVVEDNKINGVIAEKLLGRWGASTELATDGEQAVRMASDRSYDLILMDIHMPGGIDGIEATRLIRSLPDERSQVPIFVLSADVMVNQNQEVKDYFDGILSKPVDQRQLKEVIATKVKNGVTKEV